MTIQSTNATQSQIAAEIDGALREWSQKATPETRRKASVAIGWRRRHANDGTIRASRADVWADMLAGMLTDGTPTAAILAGLHAVEAIVRKHREPGALPLADAFARETEAQAQADVLQMRALTTRSLGDLHELRHRLYVERDTKDFAIASVTREIDALTAERAHALSLPRRRA